ncbi:MAG: hypothetical protein MR601_06925 [Erysipelotrichaceae bacterium]|nr:hypothetical protein [Erysipelotrichaceae bacterium]
MTEKTEKFNKNNYTKTYNKKNYKNYSFRLNKDTEKDVIDFIEMQSDKKNYFVSLVKKDMTK